MAEGILEHHSVTLHVAFGGFSSPFGVKRIELFCNDLRRPTLPFVPKENFLLSHAIVIKETDLYLHETQSFRLHFIPGCVSLGCFLGSIVLQN